MNDLLKALFRAVERGFLSTSRPSGSAEVDLFSHPDIAKMEARALADLPMAHQRRTWPARTRWETGCC